MPLACRIGLVAVGFDAQKISLVQMGLDDADDDKTASELDAMIIENSITKTCELNKLQLKVCDIVRQCIQDVAASSVCKFIAGGQELTKCMAQFKFEVYQPWCRSLP